MQQIQDQKSMLLDFSTRRYLIRFWKLCWSSIQMKIQKRAAKEKEKFHDKRLTVTQIAEKYFRRIYREAICVLESSLRIWSFLDFYSCENSPQLCAVLN